MMFARNQNNVSEWSDKTTDIVAPLGHIILIPSQPV